MVRDTHYMGREGFWWFHGVVEDRQDPEKLGRIRVRVLGAHTKDKSYIKTEELQWAYVVLPITSASMNGIGTSPVGPVPGTWVIGFFRDGPEMQEPCIIGTIGGIPETEATNEGFNDPRDYETLETLQTAPRTIETREYPTDGSGAKLTNKSQADRYPKSDFIGEPDTHRLARGIEDNTIIEIIKDMMDQGVKIAFEGTWSEPAPWYKGKYPYVHTEESESGHTKVVDDTPGSEGTLDFDRTGTFKQVQTDGSEVHKIVKDGYTIVLGKNYVHVMNDQNERCEKEYNLSVGGRWNVEVEGNINLHCDSSLYAKVDGDINVKSGGDTNIGVDGDANVNVSGDTSVTSGQDVNVKADGKVNIKSDQKLSLVSGGSIHIKADGDFALDASIININSGVSSPNTPSDAETPIEPKQ